VRRILTGIQGGHEQREPRQLILHRCFHVPGRSLVVSLTCRTGGWLPNKRKVPSFGILRARESVKAESNRIERSGAESQSGVCSRFGVSSFTLSVLFHPRFAFLTTTITCAYHATDRAPLTRELSARNGGDDGDERTRAEFRRLQRACVDRSRHRSRESVSFSLRRAYLLSRAVLSRVSPSLSFALALAAARSARLLASSSCTSVAPAGADVVMTLVQLA